MIERVRFINELDKLDLPIDHYVITGSAWLALLGVRKNRDLDLLITKQLMDELYDGEMPGVIQGTPFDIQGGHLRHPYCDIFSVTDNDDLIKNYREMIDGYPFLQFRFYREFKKNIPEVYNITEKQCYSIVKVDK